MTDWLTVSRNDSPLVVSIPHAGTDFPAEIAAALIESSLALTDTDWYVDRLYAFASGLGATIITTSIGRAAIDVNRDPGGASLYPGQATTDLCPTQTFGGAPLYDGNEPSATEVARRRARWFDPYHEAIAQELDRLRARWARVVLWDAHAIRSRVPRLFPGELPVFNVGTNSGRSCAPELVRRLAGELNGQDVVIDGRFKGGWITRNYGRPENGVHSVQLELAMRAYLDEEGAWPPTWEEARSARLGALLGSLLQTSIDFARGTP